MTKQNNKLTASSSVWCRFAGGGVTGLVSGARPPAPGEPEPAAEGAGETNSDTPERRGLCNANCATATTTATTTEQ